MLFPPLPIAGIGPFTSLLETLATAVGAGIVLGGFTARVIGLLSRDHPRIEVRDAGSFGGLLAVAAIALDAIFLLIR